MIRAFCVAFLRLHIKSACCAGSVIMSSADDSEGADEAAGESPSSSGMADSSGDEPERANVAAPREFQGVNMDTYQHLVASAAADIRRGGAQMYEHLLAALHDHPERFSPAAASLLRDALIAVNPPQSSVYPEPDEARLQQFLRSQLQQMARRRSSSATSDPASISDAPADAALPQQPVESDSDTAVSDIVVEAPALSQHSYLPRMVCILLLFVHVHVRVHWRNGVHGANRLPRVQARAGTAPQATAALCRCTARITLCFLVILSLYNCIVVVHATRT